MTHGAIAAWSKKEGDAVAEGDTLLEVDTDKSTMQVEAKDEGFVAKIFVEDGTSDLPLGEPLAILVEDEADIAAFKDYVLAGADSTTSPAVDADVPAAASPSTAPAPSMEYPEHVVLGMPKVSPTMTVGRLIEWTKSPGDPVESGEQIASVETDKAVMPIECKDEGFLAKILVDEDTADIPLGQPLAILVEEEDFIAAFKDYVPLTPAAEPPETPKTHSSTPSAAPTPASPISSPSPTTAASSASSAPDVTRISPAVARLLNEFPAVDLSRVAATGPKGLILKSDVIDAISNGSAFGLSPTGTASDSQPAYTDVPVTSMRRAIARRLSDSKQTIPHRYASANYELDALLALRKRINAADPSPAVSVNDFVIRAAALALRRVPQMNANWDAASGMPAPCASVDVAFAVAIEGGLITPIVRNADTLTLGGVAAETKRLAGLAREGKLQPEEYEGGSFSTTNLGMYGVSSFSAIINPPQSGIIAVGSSSAAVLPGETDGSMRFATVGTATLSADARIADEETAAKFVEVFAGCLSDPMELCI